MRLRKSNRHRTAYCCIKREFTEKAFSLNLPINFVNRFFKHWTLQAKFITVQQQYIAKFNQHFFKTGVFLNSDSMSPEAFSYSSALPYVLHCLACQKEIICH